MIFAVIILLSKEQFETFEVLEGLRKMVGKILDTLLRKLFATKICFRIILIENGLPAEVKGKFFDVLTLSFETSQKVFQALISNFSASNGNSEKLKFRKMLIVKENKGFRILIVKIKETTSKFR